MKTRSYARWGALGVYSRYTVAAFAFLVVTPYYANAQIGSAVDSLVRQAAAVNSTIRSAAMRVEAARQRVGPAGSWPDPMLMLGVMNAMIGGERRSAHATPMGPDPMRMNAIGLEQTVPFPGKLSLARRAAEARVREAEAELARIRLEVSARVRAAYYDAAFQTRALEVVDRNADILSSLIAASEARYVSAGGSQVELRKRCASLRRRLRPA